MKPVIAGWKYEKLIINAALTGMIPQKKDTPEVPITAQEIIEDAKRCHKVGASIVHIHARDADGIPTWRPETYAEIIGGIREKCPDLIICASTSGRNFQELEKRSAILFLEGDLKPDLASLTLGSFNFPKQASINPPDIIKSLATLMKERGIKPELEIFDLGMLDYAHHLIEKELIDNPAHINLFLGSLGTLSATPSNLAALLNSLPKESIWSATGIGRFQNYVNNMAIASGGHIRVGLEDNIWYDHERTILATNEMLVIRAVATAQGMGREIATPTEARKRLGLQTS
ncbi:MAG: 3-keto-5-aminohexanoate cleavage protein [Candidatus Sedimenticola sp. (ex Thyasira tokunagai)]